MTPGIETLERLAEIFATPVGDFFRKSSAPQITIADPFVKEMFLLGRGVQPNVRRRIIGLLQSLHNHATSRLAKFVSEHYQNDLDPDTQARQLFWEARRSGMGVPILTLREVIAEHGRFLIP
jgi:hypothetical protein